MNLFNKYLLLMTFETDDNYSIRFEMKNTIRTALVHTTWDVNQTDTETSDDALPWRPISDPVMTPVRYVTLWGMLTNSGVGWTASIIDTE